MSYFTNIPVITYWNRAVANISKRVVISQKTQDTFSIYHTYTIQDGDRPDTIAFYYYNDADLDWLVMLVNNIYDLTSQWPLNSDEFSRNLQIKYGSVEAAQSTIDHYALATNVRPINADEYSSLSSFAQKYWQFNQYTKTFLFMSGHAKITATPVSYANFDASEQGYWTPVTVFDTEYQANENKRLIRLIDREYAGQVDNILQNLMLTS